jgi:hypothetical protein
MKLQLRLALEATLHELFKTWLGDETHILLRGVAKNINNLPRYVFLVN